jgi:hypothetical protein
MVRSAVRRPATKKAFAIATSAALAFAASIGAAGSAQAAGVGAYTATVTPAVVDSGVAHTSFAVTITNSATSTVSLGSATVAVPGDFGNVTPSVSPSVAALGWSVFTDEGGVIHLVLSTSQADDDVQLPNAVQPGHSIVVTVVADTPSTSAMYPWPTSAQSDPTGDGPEGDDLPDALFTLVGAQPQVAVGIPDHLVFVTQPTDVQLTGSGPASYICPAPSVEAVTADGAVVTSGTAAVTLLANTAFGDPSLGGTTSATSVAGLATFGVAGCTSGVDAQHLGTGFRLQATGTWTLNSLSKQLATVVDSNSFNVSQVVTPCAAGAACNGAAQDQHTSVTVQTTTSSKAGQLEIAVGVDSFANTTCHPYFQPTGVEVTRVVADNRGKTVTLTFDKTIVNQKPLYLILLFPICFSAPWGGWVTELGHAPTFNTTTQEYEGLLPICLPRLLPAGNPCVSSRSYQRNGSEVVTVSIPFLTGRADPKLW